MQPNTKEALRWIVTILKENDIPYQVGGGAAMALYGSDRQVNDIDISLSGKYFPGLVPIVEKYIVAGPKHYQNEKWDCVTLSLRYCDQDIDLTDVDTLLMKSGDDAEWIKNKDLYAMHPDVEVMLEEYSVTLMHPRVLLAYKEHLAGTHQEADREFLRAYLKENQL